MKVLGAFLKLHDYLKWMVLINKLPDWVSNYKSRDSAFNRWGGATLSNNCALVSYQKDFLNIINSFWKFMGLPKYGGCFLGHFWLKLGFFFAEPRPL